MRGAEGRVPSAEGTARAKVLGQEMFGALQGLGVATAFLVLVGEGPGMGGNFPDPLRAGRQGDTD